MHNDVDYVLLNMQTQEINWLALMELGAMIIPDLGTIRFNPSICLAFNTNFDVDDMTVLCASSYANNVVHLHLL